MLEEAPTEQNSEEIFAKRFRYLSIRRATEKVRTPAAALEILALGGFMFSFAGFFMCAGIAILEYAKPPEFRWTVGIQWRYVLGFTIYFSFGLLQALVMWIGARSLKRLKRYWWCVCACFLAFVPFYGFCWPFGLWIGLWGLTIVFDSDVRTARKYSQY